MAAIGIQFEFNIGDRVSIPAGSASVIGVVVGLQVNRVRGILLEVETVTTTGFVQVRTIQQSLAKAA